MTPDRIGFSGHKWLQHPEEIDLLLELIAAEGVSSYLEIGAFCGDTFHAVGQVLRPGGRMVAIDWPAPMVYSSVTADQKAQALDRAVADLVASGRDARLIRGNSRDEAVIADAESAAPYDMVFIDGDHSIKGAKSDWLDYGPMGRLVVFHDIAGDDRWSSGPKRLWGDLKCQYRHIEFIAPNTRRGIGVLWRT